MRSAKVTSEDIRKFQTMSEVRCGHLLTKTMPSVSIAVNGDNASCWYHYFGGKPCWNLFLLWRHSPSLTWPGHFFLSKLYTWCPISSAYFQCDSSSGLAAVSEKNNERLHSYSLPIFLICWVEFLISLLVFSWKKNILSKLNASDVILNKDLIRTFLIFYFIFNFNFLLYFLVLIFYFFFDFK